MAAGSGTNPPTTPGDSTNMSNVQDLEEEVVHLREKQAETERKVDEVNARLAVALGEVASLWQVVEAMREQLFPTPSHLQCPALRQAFAPTQPASDSTCPEVSQCAHPSPYQIYTSVGKTQSRAIQRQTSVYYLYKCGKN